MRSEAHRNRHLITTSPAGSEAVQELRRLDARTMPLFARQRRLCKRPRDTELPCDLTQGKEVVEMDGEGLDKDDH